MRCSYVADKCVNGQNHFGKPRHGRTFKGHTVNKDKSLVITQNLGACEWKNQPWIFRQWDLLWPSLWIHQEKGVMQMTSARHHVDTPSASVIQCVRACDTKEKKRKWNTHVCIYECTYRPHNCINRQSSRWWEWGSKQWLSPRGSTGDGRRDPMLRCELVSALL